jgi:hypothetical protein
MITLHNYKYIISTFLANVSTQTHLIIHQKSHDQWCVACTFQGELNTLCQKCWKSLLYRLICILLPSPFYMIHCSVWIEECFSLMPTCNNKRIFCLTEKMTMTRCSFKVPFLNNIMVLFTAVYSILADKRMKTHFGKTVAQNNPSGIRGTW